MNEKLSFQNISDILAQKSGLSKKSADTFAKAFFDTIMDALYQGEESIKIKGLGTFKLVAVEDRESVNVTNGERILIPGYKKVSFSPEDSVLAILNPQSDEPMESDVSAVGVPAEPETFVVETSAEAETLADEIPAEAAESANDLMTESEAIEQRIRVPEPTHVEEPMNAFGGIDMLISTPESVEEVRQQFEEAKAKMDVAIEEARKANAEKLRLEKLLERLEHYTKPESLSPDARPALAEEPQTSEVEEKSSMQANVAAVEEKAETTPEEPSVEENAADEPLAAEKKKDGGKKTRRFWLVVLVSLFLAAIVFFLYRTFRSIEAVENVAVVEKPVSGTSAKPSSTKTSSGKPSQPKEQSQTAKLDSATTSDALKKQEEKKDTTTTPLQPEKEPVKVEQKPTRPQTHRVRPGESLTRISQKYYGTKDSVRAILRINTFRDPDNIPVGATIKLP